MKQRALLQLVQEILFQEWDPIGVNDSAACKNEYDSYALTICRLLQAGADEYKLIAHLQQLQKVSMGLSVINDERDQQVAERLRSLVRK